MPENKNIEELFKERLENFSVQPNHSVWSTIQRNLFYKRFFKFNPLSLNIWYGLIIIVTGITLIVNPFKKEPLSIQNNGIYELNNQHLKFPELNTDTNHTDRINNQIKTDLNSRRNNYSHNIEVIQTENVIDYSDNPIHTNNIINSDLESETDGVKRVSNPIPDFKIENNTVCQFNNITFVNTSQNCESYQWDFGNGQTSTMADPCIEYKQSGKYTVTLKCINGTISNTIKKAINVLPKPHAEFTVKNPNLIFSGEKTEFLFNGTNSTDNQWFFGDGNTAKGLNAYNTYEEAGKYKVALVSSQSECSDTFATDIIVRNAKYKISVPTAFTPDLNGPGNGWWKTESKTNSIFYPVINFQTIDYKLRIYDKFGNLIFFSNDPDYGWNGWYNNKPANTNVYIWECEVKFIDGETTYKKGNVTLIHSEY